LGTIIPNSGKIVEGSTYNKIPVSQQKTLAENKEEAKMELIDFLRVFASEEEKNKLSLYKEKINGAVKADEIKGLLKTFLKKIVHDQIKQALADFSPSLEESDLAPESQNDIRELTNENEDANSKVKDANSARKIRDDILEEIETIKSLFEAEKELRKSFIEEIKIRLELAKNNN